MSRAIAFPFLVLPDEAVQCSGWRIGVEEGELAPCGPTLEGWDYSTAVRAEVDIGFDAATVATCLGLEATPFGITAVVWWSTGLGAMPLRHVGQRVALAPGAPMTLGIRVPGQGLSSRIRLELELFCTVDADPAHALAPDIPMARVWSLDADVLLEGGGASRFPLEARSFSEEFPDDVRRLAPWYLCWRSGAPDADFSSAVRLWINADLAVFMERFTTGDALTVQAVLGDVKEQIVSGTLETEEFALDGDYGEGTVGAQVRYWIESAFPGLDLDQVRGMLKQDRGRFSAALLASAAQGEKA